MELKYIYKFIAFIVVSVFLTFIVNHMFTNLSDKQVNEVAIRQSLSNITKSISVNQDNSGDYGIVTEPLPYVGCNLTNSYLDSGEIQNVINILSKTTKIFCISEGVGKGNNSYEIKKWAITAKLNSGKYWCVDEDGSRQEINNQITTAHCL